MTYDRTVGKLLAQRAVDVTRLDAFVADRDAWREMLETEQTPLAYRPPEPLSRRRPRRHRAARRVEAEIVRQRRFEDLLAHDIRTDFGAAT